MNIPQTNHALRENDIPLLAQVQEKLLAQQVTIPYTDGRIEGGNLFHSFGAFNVQSGERAGERTTTRWWWSSVATCFACRQVSRSGMLTLG